MRIVNVEQGTDAWKDARAAKVTASKISDVMAKGRGGAESATRADYLTQIVTEILTGQPCEAGFTSADMQWGKENEPLARATYETREGVLVDQVGFVIHPTLDRAGCSPDGLLGWDGEDGLDGIIQFKCPKTKTHIKYLMAGTVPTDYQPQMLWEMACTGAQWCDFVSFDPRLPEDLQLFVVRFKRDQTRIDAMEAEVRQFLAEVDEIVERLRRRVA